MYTVGIAVFAVLITFIYFMSDVLKRIILKSSVFNDRPNWKVRVLKFLNPDFSDIMEESGSSFFCKCLEISEAPGVRPGPSNQGKFLTCTVHAVAKCVVSAMDRRGIDVKQDDILNILQDCIGTTERTWPTSFDDKLISVVGQQQGKEASTIKGFPIRLNVSKVKFNEMKNNQIPNNSFEYVLCTSVISKHDLHAVYIEEKDNDTNHLKCINSWGSSNESRPVVLIGDQTNKFFRVKITMFEESSDIEAQKQSMPANIDNEIRGKSSSKKTSSRKGFHMNCEEESMELQNENIQEESVGFQKTHLQSKSKPSTNEEESEDDTDEHIQVAMKTPQRTRNLSRSKKSRISSGQDEEVQEVEDQRRKPKTTKISSRPGYQSQFISQQYQEVNSNYESESNSDQKEEFQERSPTGKNQPRKVSSQYSSKSKQGMHFNNDGESQHEQQQRTRTLYKAKSTRTNSGQEEEVQEVKDHLRKLKSNKSSSYEEESNIILEEDFQERSSPGTNQSRKVSSPYSAKPKQSMNWNDEEESHDEQHQRTRNLYTAKQIRTNTGQDEELLEDEDHLRNPKNSRSSSGLRCMSSNYKEESNNEQEEYLEENEKEPQGFKMNNWIKEKITGVLAKITIDRKKVEEFKLKLKEQLIEEWNETSHCKIVRGIDKEKWKGFVEHFQSSMNVSPTVLAVLQDINFADSSQDNIKVFNCKTTEIDGSYGMVLAIENLKGKIDVAYAVYDVKLKFVGQKDSKKANYKIYNAYKTDTGLFRLGAPLIEDVLTGKRIEADQRVSMEDVEDLSQNFIIEKAMIAFYQAGTIPKVMYTDQEGPALKQLTSLA